MIVAGWAPMHGQCAATTNIAILAMMTAMTMKKRCVLLQTSHSQNQLDDIFNIAPSKDASNAIEVGLDGLFKLAKSESLTNENIYLRALNIYEDKLSIITATNSGMNINLFNEDMNAYFLKILLALNNAYDYVFVDTNAGTTDITKLVFENSELVVAFLPQNSIILKQFFAHTKDTLKTNLIYCLGMYEARSSYNAKNLKKVYASLGSDLLLIPYSPEIRDANNEGKILNYVLKNCTDSITKDVSMLSQDRAILAGTQKCFIERLRKLHKVEKGKGK